MSDLPTNENGIETPDGAMRRIDALLSHVWMVRTFLKHSEEAEEIEELREVHRELYDYMLALGGPWQAQDSAAYLKLAAKKLSKLRKITQQFVAEQPEISSHTNFQMAARSLQTAVGEIDSILAIFARK
jgi:cob(I)alamin adenosyltransferase